MLVFCSSRKGTKDTAQLIQQHMLLPNETLPERPPAGAAGAALLADAQAGSAREVCGWGTLAQCLCTNPEGMRARSAAACGLHLGSTACRPPLFLSSVPVSTT